MARASWIFFNLFHGPVSYCRHHFYKSLILILCALLVAQYGLSVLVYQTGGYFSSSPSSLASQNLSSSRNQSRTLHKSSTQPVSTKSSTSTVTAVLKASSDIKHVLLLNLSRTTATVGPGNVSVPILQSNNNHSVNKNHSIDKSETTASAQLNTKPTITSGGVLPSISTKVNSKIVVTTVAPETNIGQNLSLCPIVPPKLVGAVKVWTDPPSIDELEKLHPELELGGRFRPKTCKSRSKVAIIIPYRDREVHLRMFLHNMHPILQRQQLDYGIYVIEQKGKGRFNRAMLMNVGFAESLKQYDYDCFVFHDVDLLPEDDRNLYSCPEQPRHMSVAIDVFNYKLPYEAIFGGVSALTKAQFEKINGFSNQFWGWGGEDDDMANRIKYYGYKISRYPNNIAKYKMMKHKKDEPNPDRYNKLYKGKQRYKTDGINSLKYTRADLLLKRLYTWVYVELHK